MKQILFLYKDDSLDMLSSDKEYCYYIYDVVQFIKINVDMQFFLS